MGAALLEPDGTPVGKEVLLLHGLMDSPNDLRQIARRYRPGADPSGSIPPRQWASASITSEKLEREKDHADGKNDDPWGKPADSEASRRRALHDPKTS